MITLGAFNDINGIRHGFFTREGGVSEGIYASLNCGFVSKDDPQSVEHNREICGRFLDQPESQILSLKQCHSAKVIDVQQAWTTKDAPEADAMVTHSRNLVLGIMTADCVPVLLVDEKAGVIGAAHAGWKGALRGVVEATIEAMTAKGAKPERILAGLGPCIHQRSYEVDVDFRKLFTDENPDYAVFFTETHQPNYFLFDMPGFVREKLMASGVELIQTCPHDTYAEADRFFSYRRACHASEQDYGRQLSAIVLT